MLKFNHLFTILSISVTSACSAEIIRESDHKNRWEAISYEASDLQAHRCSVDGSFLSLKDNDLNKKHRVFSFLKQNGNHAEWLEPIPELAWSGPGEDFSGKGKLRIYIDLSAKTLVEQEEFHQNVEKYKSELLIFEVFGTNLTGGGKTKKLGFNNFSCTKRIFQFLGTEKPAQLGVSNFEMPNDAPTFKVTPSTCTLTTDYEHSFIEIEGIDPRNVNFQLKASPFLVEVKFRKMQLVWSRQ